MKKGIVFLIVFLMVCSVSTYRIFRFSSGSSATYLSTVPFFNAAATIADTLKVFLLLVSLLLLLFY